MDQGVDQSLAQRLMHRRVVNPLARLQLKRHLQIYRQLQVHLAEKVIHIARPTAIGY